MSSSPAAVCRGRPARLVTAIGAAEQAMHEYAYPLVEMTFEAAWFGGGGLAQLS